MVQQKQKKMDCNKGTETTKFENMQTDELSLVQQDEIDGLFLEDRLSGNRCSTNAKYYGSHHKSQVILQEEKREDRNLCF